MKTIKYNENLEVVCPTCNKIILKDTDDKGDTIHPCKHLKLWINSVDDYAFAYAHKSIKKEAKQNEGNTINAFRKIAKRDKLITVKYKSDYTCGCNSQFIYDLLAFSK